MKCEFCKQDFSDPVLPHHLERCEKAPKKKAEEKQEPIKEETPEEKQESKKGKK